MGRAWGTGPIRPPNRSCRSALPWAEALEGRNGLGILDALCPQPHQPSLDRPWAPPETAEPHNSGICRDLGNAFPLLAGEADGSWLCSDPPVRARAGTPAWLMGRRLIPGGISSFLPALARRDHGVGSCALTSPRLCSRSCNSREASGPINQGLFPANTVCCFPQGNSFTGGEVT